ncbi:PepSY domain-containing protein [Aestuariispira insulae]|uniref:YpeB-like protein with putative protease inhibitory function n=1 Tax=Aestuariispira insulae TaxID=1461337 RepID=A0A3D9HYF1_9PROT|nr:PepSY domain-containing protein [Aestuariispira insulae]RED53936.1 YpeB-like protein with putative protease inhibitory function [Aestuariispira insulae]
MKKNHTSLLTLSAMAAVFGLATGAAIYSVTDARANDSISCAANAPALADEKIAAMLEGEGYKVMEIEREDNCLEVEVSDAQGKEWELSIDPASGRILAQKEDD